MSRYKIDLDEHLIHVGYDQPLRTFFATVEKHNLVTSPKIRPRRASV